MSNRLAPPAVPHYDSGIVYYDSKWNLCVWTLAPRRIGRRRGECALVGAQSVLGALGSADQYRVQLAHFAVGLGSDFSDAMLKGIRLFECVFTVCGLLALAGTAFAHPITPQTLWLSWDIDPPIVLGIAVVALWYAHGVLRVWQRAGMGHGVQRVQVALFASGIFVLVVALVSPLSELGEQLFSAHMAQHMLLILGAPFIAFWWGLPMWARRALASLEHTRFAQLCGKIITQPIVIWVLVVGTFYVWHVPELYELAVVNDTVHAVEHLRFVRRRCSFGGCCSTHKGDDV